jgi:hypothetical protein
MACLKNKQGYHVGSRLVSREMIDQQYVVPTLSLLERAYVG